MKTILRAIFLIALLPAVVYAQPAPGGTVVIRDSTTASQRAAVNSSGEVKTNASQSGSWTNACTQSGTWTVQPGNTANSTPWLVTETPAASGGLTNFHLVSAGSTNATNIKATPGQLYCWYIYNSNASMRKVALHNTAGTPTAGSSVAISFPIPPGSAANACINGGLPFSTGIGITMVTGIADSDNNAVAANDLVVNLWYK